MIFLHTVFIKCNKQSAILQYLQRRNIYMRKNVKLFEIVDKLRLEVRKIINYEVLFLNAFIKISAKKFNNNEKYIAEATLIKYRNFLPSFIKRLNIYLVLSFNFFLRTPLIFL